MFVAGTAGHVDHGKSTLIRALTGIDPDRLQQEKSRGMTIELGFAWLQLENGAEVSIVDVPGHERFVKHMIMGAGGFDIALLIVAADEGIMAQTREHLAILDLLEVRNGIVVITKSDIADDELAELVELEVDDELAGTSLEGSNAVRVSALNGEGLDQLRQEIQRITQGIQPRVDRSEPRMYVDRSFNIAGFGTVLTGTLDRGSFTTGDSVVMLPSGGKGRIRGLQTHGETLDEVAPGNRVAVNVNGISSGEAPRGEAVVRNGSYGTTRVFDTSLNPVRHAPRSIRHNHKLTVFAGTWEEPATVRLLSGNSQNGDQSGFAQIVMHNPRPLAVADRFVLRDTNDTLGGGTVLVIDAPRRKRNDPATLEALARLIDSTGPEFVCQHLADAEIATPADLARRSGMPSGEMRDQLDSLCESGRVLQLAAGGTDGDLYVTRENWSEISTRISTTVTDYHRTYPLRPGIPRQALRTASSFDAHSFEAVINQLEADGTLRTQGTAVRAAEFQPELDSLQQAEADTYVDSLRRGGYSPPSGTRIDPELLAVLAAKGEVVVAGDVVFEAAIFNQMRSAVINHCQHNGEVSINDVREMFDTSRKYSLALLEQLDRDNVTMRIGDLRRLR